MILTDLGDPDWNSINVWEMQVKLEGFDHFRSVHEQNIGAVTRTTLPKDIWSRDPEEIETLLESIGKLLYKLVTGQIWKVI